MLAAELGFHGQLPFVFLGLPVSLDGALLPLLNSHQLPYYLTARPSFWPTLKVMSMRLPITNTWIFFFFYFIPIAWSVPVLLLVSQFICCIVTAFTGRADCSNRRGSVFLEFADTDVSSGGDQSHLNLLLASHFDSLIYSLVC